MVFGLLAVTEVANATTDLVGVNISLLNINKDAGNYLFVRASVPPVVGGCQTDANWSFVLPLQAEIDNKIFSMLLAAQAAQSKVRLTGTGTCNLGMEVLSSVFIME